MCDAVVNGLMAKALLSSILMFAPRIRRSGFVRLFYICTELAIFFRQIFRGDLWRDISLIITQYRKNKSHENLSLSALVSFNLKIKNTQIYERDF